MTELDVDSSAPAQTAWRRFTRTQAFGYLLAIVSVGGCVVLRYSFGPILHERGRLITFTLAVAISALAAGPGPGLLATVLGMISGIVFFMRPRTLMFTHPPEAALTVLFIINSLVMVWLSAARDRATRAVNSLNRRLEERIAERSAVAEQKAIALESSQRQLREQATLLGSILDSIGDAVIVVDDAGRPLHRNPSARRLFGDAGPGEISLSRDAGEATLGQLLREQAEHNVEVVVPGPQGPTCLTLDVRPLTGAEPSDHAAVAVFHDITQRKKAENDIRTYQHKLRSLASELTLAEQRERRKIAVDLHDHIAHLLVMCKLKLSALGQRAANSDPPDAEVLDQIKQALDEAIGYTRSLIFRLSPPVLYELGLEAAVEWLAGQYKARRDLIVEVRDDKQPKPLGEDVRAVLFQSIRELLFNVVKHAHASRAIVSLARAESSIRVSVQDTGAGFDPQTLAPDPRRPGGLGLFNIRERIDLLGGTVEVASVVGRGTRITLTAPLMATAPTVAVAADGVAAFQSMDAG